MASSIILTFLEAKYSVIYNFYDGNLETFIDMSYFIWIVVSKIYYVYLFLRQQHKFARMFESMQKLDEFKMQYSKGNKTHSSPMMYAIFLGIISYATSFIHVIWMVGITEWTPEKTLQYHFEDITQNLFVWSLEEFQNGTVVKTLMEKNANGITETKLCLGGLNMVMIFCNYLHNDALANMMLTNAETIKEEMRDLEVKISYPKNDTENVSLSDFLKKDGDWAHFKLLKQALDDDNDAFDSLLKYKHAHNLMLFVYFVLNVGDGDFSITWVVRMLFNMVRASYIYRVATQASSLNDAADKWIRRLAWKTDDPAFLDRVPLIERELDKEPLGMGKGQFLIDESFIYRFLGSVGSVFVLQAQSREAKTD